MMAWTLNLVEAAVLGVLYTVLFVTVVIGILLIMMGITTICMAIYAKVTNDTDNKMPSDEDRS